MRTAAPLALLLCALLTATGAAASQEATADGELVYRQQCARCHEGGMARLTPAETLRERSADEIYATLRFGLMQRQALSLSDAERAAVAEYLSGDVLSGPPIEQIPKVRTARQARRPRIRFPVRPGTAGAPISPTRGSSTPLRPASRWMTCRGCG